MGNTNDKDPGLILHSELEGLLARHGISKSRLLSSSNVSLLLESVPLPPQTKEEIARFVNRSTQPSDVRVRRVCSELHQEVDKARILVNDGKAITEGIRKLEASQQDVLKRADALSKQIDRHKLDQERRHTDLQY